MAASRWRGIPKGSEGFSLQRPASPRLTLEVPLGNTRAFGQSPLPASRADVVKHCPLAHEEPAHGHGACRVAPRCEGAPTSAHRNAHERESPNPRGEGRRIRGLLVFQGVLPRAAATGSVRLHLAQHGVHLVGDPAPVFDELSVDDTQHVHPADRDGLARRRERTEYSLLSVLPQWNMALPIKAWRVGQQKNPALAGLRERLVEMRGIEPLTFALRTRRSPS